MPTAKLIYLGPPDRPIPSSPFPGDTWDVTTVPDTVTALAAIENQPSAILVVRTFVPPADLAKLRLLCSARKVALYVLDQPEDANPAASELERARMDRQIDQLRELGGDSFVIEMIDLLLQQTPRQLGEMRASLGSGNASAVHKIAHSLKSSAGNFGASILQELCFRTERSALQGVSNELVELVEQVEVAFERAKRHLELKR